MAVSLSIGITQNSQNIANNTSNVTVTVTAKWTYGSYNKTSKSGWLKIDGEKYDFTSSFNTGQSTSGSQVLFSKTVNISHDSTGAKTLSCSASFTTGVSSGTVTASASKVLTTIARKSTLSASDGTLGTSQTLTVSRYSTSYTHTITYKCGSVTGTIATKSSSTSISFTPHISLASQSENSLYVSVVFTITTYSGDDPLGSTTKTISCYIPDSSDTNPTVSISVSDAEDYLSTYGGYVQNKSKLRVTVTALGKQGADIKSRTTTISKVVNNVKTTLKTYTGSSFTTDVLSTSGELAIDTTVIDSRGRKAAATATITVLAYSPPQITSLSAYRSNSSGTASENGSYITVKFNAKVTSVNNENNVVYSVKYRITGTQNYTPVPLTSYNNQYNITNGSCTFSANQLSSYDVMLYVDDDIEEVEKSTTGQTVTKTFSIFRKGLGWAFGKIAEVQNALDVAWNIIARKDIYMGYYHDNEKNIFFKNNAEQTGKTFSSNGVYPHNCRVYGGSSSSPIGIGFYDTKNKRRIFAYNDHEKYVETQVNIRQHIFQAYPSSSQLIENKEWNTIKLNTAVFVSGLNPNTNNFLTGTKFFELVDSGIKCNSDGHVMISGQLYLGNMTANEKVAAGIYIDRASTSETDEYLTWTDLRLDSTDATIPIAPIVVSIKNGDKIYLVGKNYHNAKGMTASGNTYKTTRLVVQYVG